MGLDLAGADKAVKRLNEETIPLLRELSAEMVADLRKEVADLRSDLRMLLRRLDGASITLKLGDENENHSDSALPVACHEPSGASSGDHAE
jgi:hypothetical protein